MTKRRHKSATMMTSQAFAAVVAAQHLALERKAALRYVLASIDHAAAGTAKALANLAADTAVVDYCEAVAALEAAEKAWYAEAAATELNEADHAR